MRITNTLPVTSGKLRVLTFDTETTGLIQKHVSFNAMTPEWLATQAHVMQLAWSIHEVEIESNVCISTTCLHQFATYIKPNDKDSIKPETLFEANGESIHACRVNHITYDMLMQSQYTIDAAIRQMFADAKQFEVDVFIAHNAQYDVQMLAMEMKRNDMQYLFANKMVICTRNLFKPFAIKQDMHATLENAYKYFNHGNMFDNAHDALADVFACFKVFVRCCEAMHTWPMKNAIASIQCYANGTHKSIPTSIHDAKLWLDTAEIDVSIMDASEAHTKTLDELKRSIYTCQFHFNLPMLDENSIRAYNVDVDACKADTTPIKLQLAWANALVSLVGTVIVHGAHLHLGLWNTMCIKHHVANSLFECHQSIIDLNDAASRLLHGAQSHPGYVKRDTLFEWLYGTYPTIDIYASASNLLNACALIKRCTLHDKVTCDAMRHCVYLTQDLRG